MSPIIIFLAVIAAIAGWWLSQQRLTAKPWLEEGPSGGFPETAAPSLPPSKIGLGVFLAVVSCLFTLFISAYFMRMDMADWRPIPTPKLLWLNTGLLIFSSAVLQWTRLSARLGLMDNVKTGLLAGGISAIAFLAGQTLAWKQLFDEGYFLATSPASAFFYLVTGMHGLHLMGGIVALGRTIARSSRGCAVAKLRLSIELCVTYWHFLLLIWLVLFVLFAHWADGFVVICHSLLS